MTRNDAREIMMQILYEMDAAAKLNEDTARELTRERLSGNHVLRGQKLLLSILTNLEDIDAAINACSNRWKTSRMPKVDLAILRLAVGEMTFAEDISDAVAINEAINLGKKYSTEGSGKFIHGLLGAISRRRGEDGGPKLHSGD